MRVLIKEPDSNIITAIEAMKVTFETDKDNECMGNMIVKTTDTTGVCKMPRITYDKYIDELCSTNSLDLRHRQFTFTASK